MMMLERCSFVVQRTKKVGLNDPRSYVYVSFHADRLQRATSSSLVEDADRLWKDS